MKAPTTSTKPVIAKVEWFAVCSPLPWQHCRRLPSEHVCDFDGYRRPDWRARPWELGRRLQKNVQDNRLLRCPCSDSPNTTKSQWRLCLEGLLKRILHLHRSYFFPLEAGRTAWTDYTNLPLNLVEIKRKMQLALLSPAVRKAGRCRACWVGHDEAGGRGERAPLPTQGGAVDACIIYLIH